MSEISIAKGNINLTPRGLQTQEGIKRNTEAVSELETANAELANILVQCLTTADSLAGSLRKLGLDPEEIDDVVEAYDRRAAATEEFLRSMTGAPPVKKT